MVSLFAPRKPSPRLERLRALSLFSQLQPAELRIIDGLMHERHYQAGEVIFDEGEDGQGIYIVLDGEVLIRRQHGETDGVHIARLGPGTFFGDMALLDSLPRAAQARALVPARMAVFFREDFIGLMETHARIASKIALQLAREMAHRLRHGALGESERIRV